MYLSKKNRTADIAAHALVKLYEEEQQNTLSKMGRISHEVEQVTRMVKVLWNSSDKQLALEKLTGVLDALNSLRYNQRELIKKADETAKEKPQPLSLR